jgi:hypothetical protein
VKANGTPTENALSWWLKSQATFLADLGDPTSTTDYEICVYDGTAGITLKLRANAPAGSGWTRRTRGFTYASKAPFTPDGLKSVRLVAGANGNAQVRVRGQGANLAAQQPPYTPKVTAQLKASNGNCWDATYSTPTTDVAGRFRAKSP